MRLLNEAVDDPNVLSIKITIYRLASSSKIAKALCRAAEKGKEVLALMELRARFDEAHNLEWAKMLEESGCQVIYGIIIFTFYAYPDVHHPNGRRLSAPLGRLLSPLF